MIQAAIFWAIFLSLNRITHAYTAYRYLNFLQADQNKKNRDVANLDEERDDVQEMWINQILDHFDHTNRDTFRQRYFSTKRYVLDKASVEVTFLCVGGEGPGFDKSVLVDSVHCTGDMLELAQILSTSHGVSVRVYALEHRYYGKSYPSFSDSPVTIQNLKFCSSRQALEDISHFVHYINDKEESGTRWVTFGGSYPGFLSAYARLKYPHMIFAGVSSSAPLKLVVDFPDYYHVVGKDLQYAKVGGSSSCYDIVKVGHEQAIEMIGQEKLAEAFGVCDPSKLKLRRNQEILLGDGLIRIPSQSNDPACKDGSFDCNIERLCKYMEDMHSGANTTSFDVLAMVASKQRTSDQCLEVDWDKTLVELSKPVVTDDGWRSWLWQTCSEFGFYQTCEDEFCPYATSFHMVDMDLEMCEVAFNVTDVYENVEASIDYFGGLDMNGGSRVLFVNGDVDPWSALGLLNSTDHGLPAITVPGASHHAWTHSIRKTDSKEIEDARKFIYSTVIGWLNDESGFTWNTPKKELQ